MASQSGASSTPQLLTARSWDVYLPLRRKINQMFLCALILRQY
jgi:hypothetical protein